MELLFDLFSHVLGEIPDLASRDRGARHNAINGRGALGEAT